MPSHRRFLAVPLVLLAFLGAGCGTERTAKDVEEAAKAQGAGSLKESVGRDLAKAPKIGPQTGEDPTALEQADVVVGKGEAAALGDQIEVRYTLVLKDGTKIDSSWDRSPNSSTFPLEEGGLIPAWTQGIPGMRVGGRRVLVAPPALGYGAQGTGDIPPNSPLYFVVDLVRVIRGG